MELLTETETFIKIAQGIPHARHLYSKIV